MRIVISTGGTGGHINPALALAEELKGLNHTILFMGGLYGPEKSKAEKAGFDFVGLSIRGLDRSSILATAKALFLLPLAVLKAMKVFKTFRPHAVVGVGGYASSPSVIAASLRKIPLFLMEQNVYPGVVTRKFAKKALKVFTSFEGSNKWLKGAETSLAGNPVRKGFAFGRKRDFYTKKKTLLVMGGSQGARSINRSVIAALPILKEIDIEIYHHTGPYDCNEVREAYALHFPGGVVKEFFDDIDSVMGGAHLALCRAGAMTCAELAVVGLPSILVPYPGAGGHQSLNAKEMSENGAAVIIDDGELSAETLVKTIKELLGEPEKLELMSANCREAARPDATERIASEIEQVMEGKWV